MDRDRLEQEAVRLLGKNQPERALEKYLTILKASPMERRIRQKVAELYVQTGQLSKADKQYRQVVKQMIKDGQQRGAINVLKLLVKMKPDDTGLRGELGDIYMEEGFENEGIKCYTECMEKIARTYPDEAIAYCDKLIKFKPGDFSLKIQRAEYIEKAKWSEKAAAEWYLLSKESRRLGRPAEATRFLEFSLRQRGEDPVVLIAAARGQLEQGDVKRALEHLQHAHKKPGPKGEIFALLGECFQVANQKEKARTLWLQAAKALDEEGKDVERLAALEAAISCGAKDEETRAAFEAAQQTAQRLALRLHEQKWAEPTDETNGIPVVTAGTLWTYGFPERALFVLEELDEPVRTSVPVRAIVAELMAVLGQLGSAIAEIRQITPPDEGASEDIWERIAVLSGAEDEDELIDDDGEDLIDEDEDEEIFEDDDDYIDDEEDDLAADEPEELLDDEDALIEELTDPGRMTPLEPAVEESEDPLDFGSDFGSGGIDVGSGSFGDIFGGGDDEPVGQVSGVEQVMGSEGLADARAWLAIGDHGRALTALEGKQGLEAEVWRAISTRLAGEVKDAFSDLRDAIDDAVDGDVFFPEAQLELARLAAILGKERVTKRVLKQLSEDHPGFRSRDIASLRRALEIGQAD